ncbi:olfactory receptor 52K1-like [Gastrophryne carolinensis]
MNSSSQNKSFISYTDFVLLGFPGIISCRGLLAIPFTFIYITVLTGNGLVTYQVVVEPRLHSPMYILMCLLFVSNIACSTAILPKFFLGLTFDMNRITLAGCLVQMFWVYVMGTFESGILLLMAMDRFVAICRPLRYTTIMTKRLLVQLVLVVLARSLLLITPIVLLTSRVRFCRSKIILNFVCENMGLLSLSCEDISRVQIVGLLVKIFITVVDVGLLFLSYSSILYVAMKILAGKARYKALHTCIAHVTAATIIYICSLLASVVYRMRLHISYDIKNLFNAIYLMVPATLNPFIYGLGVKEIRQAVTKIVQNNNILVTGRQ